MEEVNKRSALDVATIFREYGDDFLKQHPLCLDQLKAYRATCSCRTPAIGGHIEKCDQYDHQRITYNSCRNRHCNKCQYTKQLV